MLIHDYLKDTKLVTKDGVLTVDKSGVIKGLPKSKEKDYSAVADITYKEDPQNKETPKEEKKPAEKKATASRVGRPRKRTTTKA